MSQQTSNATGTWVVVGWDLEAGEGSARVVGRFGDRAWADGYVGQQEVYGDPSLSYKVLTALEAAALGIE